MTQPALVLLLSKGRLFAWYQPARGRPQAIKIHGETHFAAASPSELAPALKDVRSRLLQEMTDAETAWTVWVLDQTGRSLWAQAAAGPGKQALFPSDRWLCLPSEWLEARLPDALDPARPAHWVQAAVLPWLAAVNADAEADLARADRQREHQSEAARLEQERETLERENQLLREQNAALRATDMERLVVYLPALFEHVFSVIPPADLALKCGRLEVPPLPNPWPEPTAETLRSLQADFRALPARAQREIVRFAYALPQAPRLRPRHEMRETLSALSHGR